MGDNKFSRHVLELRIRIRTRIRSEKVPLEKMIIQHMFQATTENEMRKCFFAYTACARVSERERVESEFPLQEISPAVTLTARVPVELVLLAGRRNHVTCMFFNAAFSLPLAR